MQTITRTFINLTQSELNRLLKRTKKRGAARLGMLDVEFDVQEHSSDKKRVVKLTHMFPTYMGAEDRVLNPCESYFNVTMRYSINVAIQENTGG